MFECDWNSMQIVNCVPRENNRMGIWFYYLSKIELIIHIRGLFITEIFENAHTNAPNFNVDQKIQNMGITLHV